MFIYHATHTHIIEKENDLSQAGAVSNGSIDFGELGAELKPTGSLSHFADERKANSDFHRNYFSYITTDTFKPHQAANVCSRPQIVARLCVGGCVLKISTALVTPLAHELHSFKIANIGDIKIDRHLAVVDTDLGDSSSVYVLV